MQFQGDLGVIGLGLVGRALAGRGLAAGLGVAGVDPSASSAAAARAQGIVVADAIDGLVARCAVLVAAVFDDGQLDAVIDAVVAAVGAAPADDTGGDTADGTATRARLLVNTVTCRPATVDRAATRLAGCGIDFIEAPLSGSSAQIADGSALAILGGEPPVIARWSSWLERLMPNHVVIGGPGTGARAKLASNLILGLNRSALAEGLALAEALGLDGDRFLGLLRRSAAWSRAVDVAGPRMVARDFHPVSRLAQHRKDLALILAEGQAAGQPLPLTEAHARLLDQAIAAGLGDSDNGAVFAALRPGPPGAPA